MIINIDGINQTIISIIAIYITYNFLWWSKIGDDCPVMLASMRWSPSKKGISNIMIYCSKREKYVET